MEYHFEDGFIAREQFYPYRTGQVPKWQLQKWTDF